MNMRYGRPGSVSGMILRIGQCVFAFASIASMFSALGFTNYTAFCYLIASMGLQLFWSFGLFCLDIFALRNKRDLQNPVLVSLFVVGDWVTATLSLAAACSSAGIAVLYARDLKVCDDESQISCIRLQISVAMAFVTWFFIAVSSYVMFWISASV